MPTPGGLPKAGEIWQRTYRLPSDNYKPHTVVFRVLERGSGSYWSLRVEVLEAEEVDQLVGPAIGRPGVWKRRQLWVDAAYWMSQGEMRFVQ